MKTISISSEVPDDFEPGCCSECPFTYLADGMYEGDGCDWYCVMGWNYEECGIMERSNG